VTASERRRARVNERGRPYVLSGPRDDDPDVTSRRVVREGTLYDLHEEVWQLGSRGRPGDRLTMRVSRTKDGHYIGDERDARFLCDQLGIAPELRAPDSNTCSHGWSEAKGRWYGWSHRAIHGFRVGDVVREGSVVERGTVGREGAGFEAGHVLATDEEARRAAMLFAEEVS
jgi:hypothetical protein